MSIIWVYYVWSGKGKDVNQARGGGGTVLIPENFQDQSGFELGTTSLPIVTLATELLDPGGSGVYNIHS